MDFIHLLIAMDEGKRCPLDFINIFGKKSIISTEVYIFGSWVIEKLEPNFDYF